MSVALISVKPQDINTSPVETKQTGFLTVIAIIVAIMRKCHPPIEIDFDSCPPGRDLSVCKSQGWRI